MCPARLVILPVGSSDDLAGERIAQVYASPAVADDAAALGERLGARLTVVPGLEAAAGESEADALRRSEAVLQEIADQHRGESVVVVAAGLSLGFALPSAHVVLSHSGDGWTVEPR